MAGITSPFAEMGKLFRRKTREWHGHGDGKCVGGDVAGVYSGRHFSSIWR